MQKELEADYPSLDIQLIGVNKVGQEAGNESATEGRDIPLLQDIDANDDGDSDVWSDWNVEWRDVVILNANNMKVGAYNLTIHNLAYPANYATLKQMLIDAASEGAPSENAPWQNPVDPLDVNGDALLSPVGDVLPGINALNDRLVCDETGRLAVPSNPSDARPYLDVNGDNYHTPAGDILPVINALNSQAAGEGEKTADNDFAGVRTHVNVLASVKTQSVDAEISKSRNGSTDRSTSYLSSSSGNTLSPRPRATNVPSVDSGSHGGPVTMDTEGELGTLEPLLVDLAEDLAMVWYDRADEVLS